MLGKLWNVVLPCREERQNAIGWILSIISATVSSIIAMTLGSLPCLNSLAILLQPVHSEGDQPWDFFGRNDAKAETPVLWPPHAKSWLIGKDSDDERDWGQEEKGTTEDEMAGWHRWLYGCESEWTLGVGDGQGGLACCDSWVAKSPHDWATDLIWSDSLALGVQHLQGAYICSSYFE